MNNKRILFWVGVLILVISAFALALMMLLGRNHGEYPVDIGKTTQQSSGDSGMSTTETVAGSDDAVEEFGSDNAEPSVKVELGASDRETISDSTTEAIGQTTITTKPQIVPETKPTNPDTVPTTTPDILTTPDTIPTTTPETTPVNSGTPGINYKQYMALSSNEQQALYDKHFAEDPLAFAAWFQKIKKEYDDENPAIIVTGPIDLEDYLNPTNP